MNPRRAESPGLRETSPGPSVSSIHPTMKPAGLLLLIFAMAGGLAAQEPPSPAKTSARLTHQIQATLPKYEAPPPKKLDQPESPATDDDPSVLALPKFTVKEKRPPTHDPDLWLTDRAIQQKAMAAYKQSMTDLEWAMNGWFIPLFSPPPSARASHAYETGKSLADLRRVHDLFGRIAATDPKAASDLEKERIKMNQAEYWQSRPAGDGRIK